MQFFKSASKLLVAALLGSKAMAELTKVPRAAAKDIVRRDLNDDIVTMCQEAGDVSEKRSLESRTHKPIRWNRDISGNGEDTLYTTGLGPCQGIAVTGTYEDENATGDDRWLAHVTGDNLGPVERLVGNVKKAQEAGLKDIEATVVYVDPDSIPEDKADAKLGEFISELNDKVIKKVKEISGLGLFGLGLDEKEHPWDEIWQLGISKDKEHEASKALDNPDTS